MDLKRRSQELVTSLNLEESPMVSQRIPLFMHECGVALFKNHVVPWARYANFLLPRIRNVWPLIVHDGQNYRCIMNRRN